MKKLYVLLAVCSFPVLGQAQTVSFTQQALGGNVPYNPCTVDMDGDHLDDVVAIGSNQLKVWKQLASGGFTLATYAVTGLGLGNATPDWSIAAGDFDGNGFTDLVLGNGSRVSLVKANTTGTGYALSTYPQNIFTQRTNFIDIDNDGNLDLWACHDVAQSHAYRNDGAGNLNFDISLMPTLAVGGNYASIWTDYNSDGHIDMYLAKCRSGAPVGDPQRINLLYKNNGDGTYTEVGAAAGVNDGAQSWSTAVEDFDNDGDMDMVLSNISDQNRFYVNNGDGTFTDMYASSGIAAQVGSWELQSADFNNDGFVDFLWENGKELYLNNGNGTFTGYDLPFGQGGIADLNNDGFLDVQVGSNIYMNNGNPNKWIKVTLQGVESNRNGIGARVEIEGTWGKQTREIRSGQGFSNMSTLNAHFGIGSATAIPVVRVVWPSGTVDEYLNVSTNSTLFVLEGSSPALGVNNPSATKFTISPNPAKDVINVTFANDTQLASAQIFDLTGRKVMDSAINVNQIGVKSLSNGAYVLLLTDVDGKTYSQKFIKE
ncbi:VCBS repeat-containing protein [Flavobacterium sp. MAH-1]|uniref:VCBS repeat-containing protein n=1 Tax=Flavobacterium agri TaxID=2743471 RepID=A0A7Y9C655_9FLAO|nr:FG-GAP-like repeat-containing protein [Flavobacterium agri]NUY82007.1 VCBS repeat-containing protein [Flavobacterium agri]NYA72031.1 VCBS repeat-containing protein [Flavobacterium agri]